MQTKLLWQYDANHGVNQGMVAEGVAEFYKKYGIRPTTIRMSVTESLRFLGQVYGQQVLTLEAGKKYANYVQTPCGPVMLDLLEEGEHPIQVAGSANLTYQMAFMVIENTEIDEEFEKVVLGKNS